MKKQGMSRRIYGKTIERRNQVKSNPNRCSSRRLQCRRQGSRSLTLSYRNIPNKVIQ
jgi:hypothetical protein